MNIIKGIHQKLLSRKEIREQPKPFIFNEAVNFEKNCIFIAIPRTGSTTVRSQIKQEGIPLIESSHLNIKQVRDGLYIYFLKRSLGNNMSFPSQGVPADSEIREKTSNIFKRYFKFSAVRNPWARSVSLYFRKRNIDIREQMSFEEFCSHHLFASDTCRHPTLHRNQIDWLTDENDQCIMDYVYKLEEYKVAIKEIEERTDGRVKLQNLKLNVNPNSPSHRYQDFYNHKTKKMIEARFERDIDTFKYTF